MFRPRLSWPSSIVYQRRRCSRHRSRGSKSLRVSTPVKNEKKKNTNTKSANLTIRLVTLAIQDNPVGSAQVKTTLRLHAKTPTITITIKKIQKKNKTKQNERTGEAKTLGKHNKQLFFLLLLYFFVPRAILSLFSTFCQRIFLFFSIRYFVFFSPDSLGRRFGCELSDPRI